jgi:hypothetical protein
MASVRRVVNPQRWARTAKRPLWHTVTVVYRRPIIHRGRLSFGRTACGMPLIESDRVGALPPGARTCLHCVPGLP